MTEIEAIYHAGRLELKSPLPLADGQPVRVIVLPESGASVDERAAAMTMTAETWLKAQAEPGAYPKVRENGLETFDSEWDELLAEIQSVSGAMDEAEIASDVAEAISQVRQHKGG